MKDALKDYPVVDFTEPKDIKWALIDPKTGLLALSKTKNAYLEAFLDGTVPTTYYARKNKYDSEKTKIETEEEEEPEGY